jgi:hypothetical protein
MWEVGFMRQAMEGPVREFAWLLMLTLVELHQCGVLMLILVELLEKHAAEREILLTD